MKVGVIGAGTMGSGIAQACAVSGHDVVIQDTSDKALERGLGGIDSSLSRLVKKEKLSEDDKQATLGRISTTSSELNPLQDAEVIIEAVFESIDVKREVWGSLKEVVSDDALLASNTSSLSITEIASFVSGPERFCGLHFFNPVPVLPLVEVVNGLQTSEATIERAKSFAEGLGKSPIVCADKPGFIVNRLLIPYLNDAVHALTEGVASAEDIDSAMKLGANMPIGPLALIDLVGADVTLAAAESLYDEFGDPKFRVAPLLRQMVRAGKLGRKSGSGFYTYD
ncbi:MAG: 3-hydroxybutyryl-CoA dehydrogenase [Trueperaceae bacterium]|nr:3-hydroxybutyryl-CoA dehydrogenase [Trueperaceae bacterium]